MAKKKTSVAKLPGAKRVKSVTVAEQNPAASDVKALVEFLKKQKKKAR